MSSKSSVEPLPGELPGREAAGVASPRPGRPDPGAPEPSEPSERGQAELPEEIASSTILVIDELAAMVQLLERHLRRAGYRTVIGTSDPRQAVPLFAEHDPDIVLLDIHMRGLDGLGTIDALEALSRPGDPVPIIVMTSDLTPEVREHALAHGARDCLAKPFTLGEVELRARNLLEARHYNNHARREMGNQMLAHVSHELRTPLAALYGAFEVLFERDSVPKELEVFEDMARRSLSQLTRMIDDLLEASTLASGDTGFSFEACDVAVTAAEVLAEFRPVADAKRITLGLDADSALPAARADRRRVRDIVSHLVSNAVKYTPDGGNVFVSARSDEGSTVLVTVSDTGCGIAPSYLPFVFDGLYQVEKSAALSSRQGLGLGLYLCKQYVLRLGGHIWADSTIGVGSRFTFSLPTAGPSFEARPA